MRKTAITVFLSLILTITMAGICYAGSVDKARDFMKAGMHKQAEAVLEQEINQNPTNAEAHFLLGKCYILLDEFRSFPRAEKRFASAVKLDPSGYAHEIANVYVDAGLEQLDKANKDKALDLLDEARKYNSGIGDEIAKRCFDQGKRSLSHGQYSKADSYFFVAARYDSGIRKDIARMYYRKYQADGQLALLKKASRYHSNYGEEYARESLRRGVNIPQSEWKKRIKEAKKHLSKQEILETNVKYYTQKWGEPQKLKLSPNEWKKGPRVYEGTKFHYLSNKEFYAKGTNRPESDKNKWKKAVTEEHWYKFKPGSIKPSDSGILEFKGVRPGTVLICWVEH